MPAKIEACVMQVMKGGKHTKEEAFAICTAMMENDAEDTAGKMQYKTLDFEIKTLEEDSKFYKFTGFAAVSGNVDRGGDMIEPGAFKRTVDHHVKSGWPITWMHDTSKIIGGGMGSVVDGKLQIEGRLYKGVSLANEVYALMQPSDIQPKGVINAMSIGYHIPNGGSFIKNNIRHLKEVAVHEVTLGPLAMVMNPQAVVIDVKLFTDSLKSGLLKLNSDLQADLELVKYGDPHDLAQTIRKMLKEF